MLQSLSLINLFVRDVPTSRRFYCDLLGVPVVSPADDQYTLLDIDGPQIYLHWTPPDTEVEYRKRGVELYFRVSDADQLAERLRANGVEIRAGPYDVGWRPWRCIQVEDPDGYVLFLASRTRAEVNNGG
jgi:catechol 2,3-dioxygenase-like lactoylglutathione lyase family enzyme